MTYFVPADVVWEIRDAAAYVVRVGDGRVLALAGAAGLIWQSVDGEPDLTGLVETLCNQHGWEASMIREDVEQCVNELIKAQVLNKSGCEL